MTVPVVPVIFTLPEPPTVVASPASMIPLLFASMNSAAPVMSPVAMPLTFERFTTSWVTEGVPVPG